MRSAADFSSRAGKRLRWVAVVFALAAAGVSVRLATLQGVEAKRYVELGASQRVRAVELRANRGNVLDRRGRALAISRDVQSVFANPRELQKAGSVVQTAQALGRVLEVDGAEIEERLSADLAFVWVARKISDAQVAGIEELDLGGVYFTPEAQRQYPSGSLAASVLGFTNIDNEGLAGIERSFDDFLSGAPGELLTEKDPGGRAIPAGTYKYVKPEAGGDIELTIDAAVQYETETALADALGTYQARAGVAAVMDPETGDVLAFAAQPSFDPNDPGSASPEARSPWGVGNVFEPGSTSKVITIAAAIEEGVVTPETMQNVPDELGIYDRTFHDAAPHPDGWWSIRDVIAKSSNIGTILTARRLGAEAFDAYLRGFGYGRRTGVELPGESSGITKDLEDWDGTDIAALAIGHTVAVTPLQMLRVFGTLANDGVMLEPRLVQATIEDGTRRVPERPAAQQVVSPATAATMRDMLQRVVSDEGTAPRAAVPGYAVAGKTGTSRKLLDDGTGYDASRHVASFVGFAPAHDPKAVVLVVLDEPQPSSGGETAAPTFARIMSFVMRALRVAPSPPPQVGAP